MGSRFLSWSRSLASQPSKTHAVRILSKITDIEYWGYYLMAVRVLESLIAVLLRADSKLNFMVMLIGFRVSAHHYL